MRLQAREDHGGFRPEASVGPLGAGLYDFWCRSPRFLAQVCFLSGDLLHWRA